MTYGVPLIVGRPDELIRAIKGKEIKVGDIARDLGVEYVLEGSSMHPR